METILLHGLEEEGRRDIFKQWKIWTFGKR